MADILVDRVVKIRKEQRCWGCAEVFLKGTRLRYSKQVDAGDFQSSYWCRVCDVTYDSYVGMLYDMGVCFGEVKEWDAWEDNTKRLPRTY